MAWTFTTQDVTLVVRDSVCQHFQDLKPAFSYSLQEAVDALLTFSPDAMNGVNRTQLRQAVDEMRVQAQRVRQYDETRLEVEDIAFLRLFTKQFLQGGQFYSLVNYHLRERTSLPAMVPYIWRLMHVLKKCPVFQGTHVYRGINVDGDKLQGLLSKYLPGMPHKWYCFSSTSAKVSVPWKFLGETPLQNAAAAAAAGAGQPAEELRLRTGVLFVIQLRPGGSRIISKYSDYFEEEEVLLPPNFTFEVVDSCRPHAGFHVLQLKELVNEDPILSLDCCQEEMPATSMPVGEAERGRDTMELLAQQLRQVEADLVAERLRADGLVQELKTLQSTCEGKERRLEEELKMMQEAVERLTTANAALVLQATSKARTEDLKKERIEAERVAQLEASLAQVSEERDRSLQEQKEQVKRMEELQRRLRQLEMPRIQDIPTDRMPSRPTSASPSSLRRPVAETSAGGLLSSSSSHQLGCRQFDTLSKNQVVRKRQPNAATPSSLCGLTDLGNSSYINCIIQSLLHCDPLRSFLLRQRQPVSSDRITSPVESFIQLLRLMSSPDAAVVSPKGFTELMAKEKNTPDDPAAFLIRLVDNLDEYFRETHPANIGLEHVSGLMPQWLKSMKNRSVIADMLFHQTCSLEKCSNVSCGRNTFHCNPAQLCYSVSLPTDGDPTACHSLQDLMAAAVTKGNQWIANIRPVFVLHVKRSRGRPTRLLFPTDDFDVSPFSTEQTVWSPMTSFKFRLFAVVYQLLPEEEEEEDAYCVSFRHENQWFKAEDEEVRSDPLTEERMEHMQTGCQLLFYSSEST